MRKDWNTIKSPYSKREIILIYSLAILSVVAFIWVDSNRKRDRAELRKDGVIVKGVVTNITRGIRGARHIHYKFPTHNRYIEGSFRKELKRDKHITVGDTIPIIYLQRDPSINRYTKQITKD